MEHISPKKVIKMFYYYYYFVIRACFISIKIPLRCKIFYFTYFNFSQITNLLKYCSFILRELILNTFVKHERKFKDLALSRMNYYNFRKKHHGIYEFKG